MAGMLFMVVCLAFQSRNVEKVDDQKEILLGVSIGTFVMCALIILLEGPGRGLPLLVPPVIAVGALAVLSFWSRSKLS
jgi:Na+/phosphate symporter